MPLDPACLEALRFPPIDPNAALLYRLNNDRNPLHADPAFAARAGFARPIPHGLATYGMAAAAIARAFPDLAIRAFETRFSRPVIPGETIVVEIWGQPLDIAFRAKVAGRDTIVLDRGRAVLGCPPLNRMHDRRM